MTKFVNEMSLRALNSASLEKQAPNFSSILCIKKKKEQKKTKQKSNSQSQLASYGSYFLICWQIAIQDL